MFNNDEYKKLAEERFKDKFKPYIPEVDCVWDDEGGYFICKAVFMDRVDKRDLYAWKHQKTLMKNENRK